MYRFSRSIYRELAPAVIEGSEDPTGRRNKDAVLRACEATVERLALDRHFAAPSRSLFLAVRWYFAFTDQERVRRVIEGHIALARDHVNQLMPEELEALEPRCSSYRRDGTPCQRPPAPGADHCPSHREVGAEELALQPAAW